jgi:hypothetical protein
MQKFVFWTGIYNIVVGIVLLIPGVLNMLGIQPPQPIFWLWLPASLVIYLGIVLIFCSRNLPGRASLVYWESFARLAAFALLAWFSFTGDLSPIAALLGLGDLLIALIYLIALPRALHVPVIDLLLDR